ncbi:hypothetical protein WDU94_002926 [Cyamophila willieti]
MLSRACIYLTLLLVINVYTLNAHEDHDDDLGLVGETDIQEGIVEESAEMNADTDILHRIRRDINETKELKTTTEAEVSAELEEDSKEEQLRKKFDALTKYQKDELMAKMTEVIIAKEKAKLLKAKKEEELQAKRREALKRKFFLNPRKEKELRAKLEGRGKEKEEKVEPKEENELKTNQTNAEVKTNQTDADKISWSTIKLMSQNYPKSAFKFQLAMEEQMMTLKKQGDFLNLMKLNDIYNKACEFQDAFHKMLDEASAKGKSLASLTPEQQLHYKHTFKVNEFTEKLKSKGVREQVAANRASDKMLQYWFKACLYLTLLIVIHVNTLKAHEDYQGLVKEFEIQAGIDGESAQKDADTDVLHRIRRDINETKEELKATTEAEVKPKIEEDPKIITTEGILKLNQTEELSKKFEHLHGKEKEKISSKLEEKGKKKGETHKNRENAKPKKEEELTTNKTNAEAKTNQEDADKISWSTIKLMSQKNQYSVSKFRLTVTDQLRTLHNEGDLINMNKLTEKVKKAYEAQYAFHNMLTNVTDKGQGISLTPVQKLHFRQIKRVQDLADMLKEKGLSEQMAVKRASDRMLEYWFKYVEDSEASTGSKP